MPIIFRSGDKLYKISGVAGMFAEWVVAGSMLGSIVGSVVGGAVFAAAPIAAVFLLGRTALTGGGWW